MCPGVLSRFVGDLRADGRKRRVEYAHAPAVYDETLFRVGSVTKCFVAAAVMKLVQDATLALDEPVRHCLPDSSLQDRTAAAGITVADLPNRGVWRGRDDSAVNLPAVKPT